MRKSNDLASSFRSNKVVACYGVLKRLRHYTGD